MNTYCIQTTNEHTKFSAMREIAANDEKAVFCPEGNPVTFWVSTRMSLQSVENLDGVLDALPSRIFVKDDWVKLHA
jgi:hypothetical protein